MQFNIEYGCKNVTKIAFDNCVKGDIMYIPSGDHNRSYIFGDPLPGVHKFINITNDLSKDRYEFDEHKKIYIDLQTNKIYNDVIPEEIKSKYMTYLYKDKYLTNVKDLYGDNYRTLFDIQMKLKIDYGSFAEKIPQQLMIVKYLTGMEKVLEIGSHFGITSLIIASILNTVVQGQLITLESSKYMCDLLIHNQSLNNLTFGVENLVLSDSNTFKNLCDKYHIIFDTLIIDRESHFYEILIDIPEILNNINLIIMTNNYKTNFQKEYIDSVLKKNHLQNVHVEANGLYEVWIKII